MALLKANQKLQVAIGVLGTYEIFSMSILVPCQEKFERFRNGNLFQAFMVSIHSLRLLHPNGKTALSLDGHITQLSNSRLVREILPSATASALDQSIVDGRDRFKKVDSLIHNKV